MKYIRKFETVSEYEAAMGEGNIVTPNILFIEESREVEVNEYIPGPANGHEYVDLGLPSGLKWATCNVGASSPEEYGLYFAWGETDGYTTEQVGVDRQFRWDEYKYSIDEYDVTKYNEADGLTTLELTDDAAHVNMGGNWRMPTEAECLELKSNTTSAWTTVNGVSGMNFTSKSDSSKLIFVPAAGSWFDGSVGYIGSYGSLWSSSLHSSFVDAALDLYFISRGAYMYDDSRCYGCSVRGVLE